MDASIPPERVGPKLKAISNTFRRTVDNSIAELGMTGAQSFILGYLRDHRESPPCQRDIETEFNIKHPTATGLLGRLAEKGYVEFLPDEHDRRLKRIVITEAGIDADKQTRSRLNKAEQSLVRDFSAQELSELHRLLDKLIRNSGLRCEGGKAQCSKEF